MITRLWRKFRWWWWERTDGKRRTDAQRAAFAEGRFALHLCLYSGRRIAFLPKEEEAREFFTHYVAPWMLQTRAYFSHRSWDSGSRELHANRRVELELMRFSDVVRVEILAVDVAMLERLGTVLDTTVEAVRIDSDLQRSETARMLGAIQAGEYVRRFKEEG